MSEATPTKRPLLRYGCAAVAALGVLSIACCGVGVLVWMSDAPEGACDAEAAVATGIDPLCGSTEWDLPVLAVADGDGGFQSMGLTALCASKASEPVGELPFPGSAYADAVAVRLPEGYSLVSASLRVTYDLDLWSQQQYGDAVGGDGGPAAACDDVSQLQTVQDDAHVVERSVVPTVPSAFLETRGLRFERFDVQIPNPLDLNDPAEVQRAACAQAWGQTLRDGYEASIVLPLEVPQVDEGKARELLQQHRGPYEARLAAADYLAPCARDYWKKSVRTGRGVSLDASGLTLTMSITTPQGGTITRTVREGFVIGN